nr:uncharacterized protein LOC111507483 [Leptinotarsa decemlineata]
MKMMRKFIDIGANLTDAMYSGIYNGTKKHEPDLQQVLQRSWDAGLSKIVITGGNLEESRKALEICRSDDRLYATVGCHPTRCGEFEQNGQDPNNYLEKLVVFLNKIKPSRKFSSSLKTEENLKTVQSLPSDKILLETDCPWCEVRPSHAGYKLISKENQAVPSVKKEKWSPHHMVKSRNEPNNIRQVFDIVSTVKQVSADEFCEKIYQNTLDLFLFDNKSNLS